jgi:hypothetical protein
LFYEFCNVKKEDKNILKQLITIINKKTYPMKKTILGLSLFISSLAVAQKGLEKIIVEKYYIANAADQAQADVDAAGNAGSKLPQGSTTYRVYADLAPGYRLIQVYADVANGHKLIFRTSTYFFNSPNGDIFPNGNKTGIKNNLLALDSYLTLGTVAKDNYGILKDNDDGLLNNVTTTGNTGNVLLNTTTEMGVPLTTNDGMIAGTGAINTPSFAGIDADMGPISDGTNVIDSIVSIDGSMYTGVGAKGPVPTDNRVLIAQLTTNGQLKFELNLLVQGGPDDIGEFFVANNPAPVDINGKNPEYTISSLTYPDKTVNIETLTHKDYNEVLFDVYPNPAQDRVNIELTTTQLNSKGSYTIYGVIGNVIAHKELNGMNGNYKETIDISSFAKGLYTIQMNVNGIVSTKKIIKN